MSESFPRRVRLLSAADYQRVFDKPLRSSDRYLTVLFRNSDESDARLGMAIAKKCAKRAVDRQRLKRLIRESFRQHRQDLPTVDLVILCRPAAVGAENAEIYQSLIRHWQQVKRTVRKRSATAR